MQKLKELYAIGFVQIRTVIGSGITIESVTGNRIENGNRITIESGTEIKNGTGVDNECGSGISIKSVTGNRIENGNRITIESGTEINPRSLSFVESTTRIRKKCHKFRVRGRTYFSSRVISVDPLPRDRW
ncbi:hypothetical protein EVAR_44497_1 [Eumeta japonica]|uniref:Uncharacterized protein n=1 Tax=Eumeta variegata TaxID=151549 RepID=A0A4C1WJU1_EUMVA|nr:hypothetical protein EVAR_44497_1 [Eumeta japonica]